MNAKEEFEALFDMKIGINQPGYNIFSDLPEFENVRADLQRLADIEKRANEVLHETYTTFDEKKIIDFILHGEGEGK